MITRAINNFPIEDFLADHGFDQISQVEWVGPCPQCHKDKKLTVNTDKRSWHCWVCEKLVSVNVRGVQKMRAKDGGGGLLSLIEWLTSCTRREAAQYVLSKASGSAHESIDRIEGELQDLRHTRTASVSQEPVDPPPGWTWIPPGLPYLDRRRITMEDVQSFGLVWCPAGSGQYANRLIFPVWEGVKLMYWQARAMWESEEHVGGRYIKSLNPPADGVHAVSSDVLFNLHRARHYPRVAICEGPIDAIRVGADAVCCFGKRLHQRQIQKLIGAGVQAVDLMFDGPSPTEPEGAWAEMIDLAPQLQLQFDVRLVFLDSGDPGEHTREQLAKYRHSAVPASQLSRLCRL